MSIVSETFDAQRKHTLWNCKEQGQTKITRYLEDIHFGGLTTSWIDWESFSRQTVKATVLFLSYYFR